MTNTPEDPTTFLDEQQAIAEKATTGPWIVDGEVWAVEGKAYNDMVADCGSSKADATFIADARTAVPRLIEIVRTQQAEIEQLRAERDRRALAASDSSERLVALRQERDAYQAAWNEARASVEPYTAGDGNYSFGVLGVAAMHDIGNKHGLPEAGE